ncbi:MAG: pilus assembly protein [Planctomycetota bacterium]|nr:pilus assembly protein [Planctomycetota bacterium]
MQKPVQTLQREKGQSLIEMAISITILLILLAGIVDLGRVFFTFITMRDAAQEAAVYASAYPDNCDRIVKRAQDAMRDAPYDAIEVWVDAVQCSPGATVPPENACAYADPLTNVEKTVRIVVRDDDFPIAMPFLGSILGTQTLPLKAEVTGTILRPPCSAP